MAFGGLVIQEEPSQPEPPVSSARKIDSRWRSFEVLSTAACPKALIMRLKPCLLPTAWKHKLEATPASHLPLWSTDVRDAASGVGGLAQIHGTHAGAAFAHEAAQHEGLHDGGRQVGPCASLTQDVNAYTSGA